MYSLTMTKARMDSLKILASEKKIPTHEVVKNEAIAVFGDTQRAKDYITGYFNNLKRKRKRKRKNTTKNFNPLYGTKTYHKCISLLRELRSNSEQV